MSTFKVSYQYAAPTGALRTGAVITEASDADGAISAVRSTLIGKLRFLKVTGATPYDPDQHELPLKKK